MAGKAGNGTHHPATGGPDRRASLDQYRRRAPVYDLELALFEPIRREAVALLGLKRGQSVIDFGCGTGLSLPLLRAAVGREGQVIGVEQSPEMIRLAAKRAAQQGWRNVTLIEAPVEDPAPWRAWPGRADAALFHFTHDVLQRPDAVASALRRLKRGACVVACGLRWAPRWALPVNAAVYLAARRSVTTLEGLDRPWQLLAQGVDAVRIHQRWLGATYLLQGVVR